MPPKAPAKYVRVVCVVFCSLCCVFCFLLFHSFSFSWRPLLLLVSVFWLHLLEKTHILVEYSVLTRRTLCINTHTLTQNLTRTRIIISLSIYIIINDSHPAYSDMIKAAISTLKERSGTSLPALKKYIEGNFNVPDNYNVVLKRVLKSMVSSGKLVKV